MFKLNTRDLALSDKALHPEHSITEWLASLNDTKCTLKIAFNLKKKSGIFLSVLRVGKISKLLNEGQILIMLKP